MDNKDLQTIDVKMKRWLFIISLAAVIILAIAALRENTFTEWREHRLEYARILREKAVDDRTTAIADNFQIAMDQNVVPGLGKIDRCITCHTGMDDPRMKDQPQPYATHSGNILKNHPPEKYGCTICHQGQGRAVNLEEAKAVGHHWDYPMLPKHLTQASCGSCHTSAEVAKYGGGELAIGEKLFFEKGCLSCHRLNGRGGSLGPELGRIGLKIKAELPMSHVKGEHTLPQWLKEHFDDPQLVVADSQMRSPGLSDEENNALTIFMLSLRGRDLPENYLSAEMHLKYYKEAKPESLSGAELFARYCESCHGNGTFGNYDKFFNKFIPAIRGSSYVQIASDEYLKENIHLGRPGTIMPGWGEASGGLTDAEIERLVKYLKSTEIPPELKIDEGLINLTNNPAQKFAGNLEQGKALFLKNCIGCHGDAGAGFLAPSLNSPSFQSASDGFIWTTIAIGRKNTAMPAFLAPGQGGLTPLEVNGLVSYIRSLNKSR